MSLSMRGGSEPKDEELDALLERVAEVSLGERSKDDRDVRASEALLTRYRDGQLSPEEAARVETWLAHSAPARARLAWLSSGPGREEEVETRAEALAARPRSRAKMIGGLLLAAAVVALLFLAAPSSGDAPPRYALLDARGGVLLDPGRAYRGAADVGRLEVGPERPLLIRGRPRGAPTTSVRLLVERLDGPEPVAARVELGEDGSFELEARAEDLLGDPTSSAFFSSSVREAPGKGCASRSSVLRE